MCGDLSLHVAQRTSKFPMRATSTHKYCSHGATSTHNCYEYTSTVLEIAKILIDEQTMFRHVSGTSVAL